MTIFLWYTLGGLVSVLFVKKTTNERKADVLCVIGVFWIILIPLGFTTFLSQRGQSTEHPYFTQRRRRIQNEKRKF